MILIKENVWSIKMILSLLIFSFLIPVSAQDGINQLNSKGERIGVWKKYHANKRIRYTGQFENGKEVGVFKYYSPIKSDHPIAIKSFDADGMKAHVQFFTIEGVLESEGNMIKKNRVGKWVFYHPDGKTLMLEENYKDGLLQGPSQSYYRNGKVTEQKYYLNGNLHGQLKRYADNGNLIDDVNYEHGKLNGPAKFYNTDGNLITSGMYEMDQKVGNWEFFENGKVVSAKKIKQ